MEIAIRKAGRTLMTVLAMSIAVYAAMVTDATRIRA
jgi:hypothetical protein